MEKSNENSPSAAETVSDVRVEKTTSFPELTGNTRESPNITETIVIKQEDVNGRLYGSSKFPEKNPSLNHKERVVVLGTGFAGSSFIEGLSKSLKKKKRDVVDITAINSRNYLLFTPLLYQVATGQVYEHHISTPVCCNMRQRGVRFLETEVKEIDPDINEVSTADGSFSYDKLVIALGTESNDFGIEGVSRYAIPLKSLKDGEQIRNRILDSFRDASIRIQKGAKPDPYLTFVVIGGGASGVELAGAIGEYANKLIEDYGDLNATPRVVLLEAQDSLMINISAKFSRKLLNALEKLGIEVMTGAKVEKVTGTELTLGGGKKIESRNVFWTAGVKSNHLVSNIGGDKILKKRGRVVVDSYLRIPNYSNIYVIGDGASPVPGHDGNIPPQTAASAVQEGKYLGQALARTLNSEGDAFPFKYRDPGVMLSLGKFVGLCQFSNGIILSGFAAWFIWRFVHLVKVSTLKNKFEILTDWIFSSIGRGNVLRSE